VRWAAVEAVQRVSAHTRLGQVRDRVGERRGRNIGTVAAVRQLLTLVFYGLRDHHIRCLAAASPERWGEHPILAVDADRAGHDSRRREAGSAWSLPVIDPAHREPVAAHHASHRRPRRCAAKDTDSPCAGLSIRRGPRPWSSTRPSPDPSAGAQLCFRPTERAPISGAVKVLRPRPWAQFPPRAPCRALLDPAAYLDAPQPADHAERKINCPGQGVDRPRRGRADLHVLTDEAAEPGRRWPQRQSGWRALARRDMTPRSMTRLRTCRVGKARRDAW
jgi:hypothetical protein